MLVEALLYAGGALIAVPVVARLTPLVKDRIPSVVRASELFKGVQKPSTTLAHMIATEVVKGCNIDGVKVSTDKFELVLTNPDNEKVGYKGWPLTTLSYWCDEYSKSAGERPGDWTPAEIRSYTRLCRFIDKKIGSKSPVKAPIDLKSTSFGVNFSKEEKGIILNVIEEAKKLKKLQAEADAKAAEQQAAVDAIAGWLGVVETPPELLPPSPSLDDLLLPVTIKKGVKKA